jgi:tripartite-type tricarboxylate transporter receptor subunit TctC
MKAKAIASFILAFAIAAGVSLGAGGKAAAQDYPTRPVKVIIAFSPAGAIDILGRFIAEKLSQKWGQQVIVENRPGGSGNIGAAAASAAPPDGYTLHFGAQTLATNVTLSPATAFDPVKSFEPIILVAASQEVFQVSGVLPYKSVQEVIDYAKANPGKLNYYSVGIGSTSHLSTVLFMDVTGTKMQHVPYSQMAQGIADVASGRTEINFGPMGSSIGNIRSGKTKALALSGPARSKLLPDVPTLTEVGVKMSEESSWYGFFAPKGTPKHVIDKINKDIQAVLDMPDMREREIQLGYRYIGGTPEKLGEHVKSEIAKWAALDKKGAFK